MSSKSEFINKLSETYNKETYIGKYGGSLFLTIVIILIFVALIIKNSFSGFFKSLKKHWKEERCNPFFMPFAGIINAPPEESKLQYTVDNFGHCLTNILKDVTSAETDVIKSTSKVINESIKETDKSIQNTRKLISNVRSSAGSLFKTSQGKLFNMSTPLRSMLINTKDMANKMQGVMTASLYTTIGLSVSLRSFVIGFKIALIIFLIFLIIFISFGIMTALMVMFIFLPITFIIGWDKLGPILKFLFTLIFEGVAVIAESIGIAGQIAYLTSSERVCFDGNTLINVKNKGKIKIKEIELNDELVDDGKVTAVFKLANHNQEVYKLNDVIVTGKHMLETKNGDFIEVKDHKNSKLIKDYREPYLYCLNTTSKRININNIAFLDWDEIDTDDSLKLERIIKNNDVTNGKLHKYFDVGIDGKTNVELEDGRLVLLQDIQVNDQLKNGERVLGIVNIDYQSVDEIKKYNIGNAPIICTPNNKINIKDLGNIALSKFNGVNIHDNVKLYQLITDTKTYTINGIKFLDYNGGLEQTLWANEYPIEI